MARLPTHSLTRAFAESFPTIEAVLEELPHTDAVPASPHTRADLDLVAVGCWGGVIANADFALVDDGLECTLLNVTSALAERHPEARIIGAANIDLDEEPSDVPWEHFGRQLLDPYNPWGFAELQMSHFRVRHTEKATLHVEQIWLTRHRQVPT